MNNNKENEAFLRKEELRILVIKKFTKDYGLGE